MKAIVCENFAPIQELKLLDVESPVAKPGEVVVNVKAAGVNYPDALVVQGLYQVKPPLPFVPGFEFAGVVDSFGDGVDQFPAGTRVLGVHPGYGAYAEQIAVPAMCLMPIPDAVSFTDAANLACAHGTAHHALKQRAQLKAGETLLVLGAAGGTGIAAVQIGKAMGAKVIAACSSEEKLAVAKQNGADVLINYASHDLRKALKGVTAGKGVDVVYDPVGGDAFDQCCRSMARNGRLLVVGFASGRIPQLPVNLALVKEFSVAGVFWGNFIENEPEVYAQNVKEMFTWFLEEKIKVVTDAVFALEQAPEALQRLMDRQVAGKLVLEI
ncbi:NADPH:quinone oxidoreductase family protein [Halioxenophilus aromaticivorans]|uniref:NADPH:quinone oxidoreductase family protein n=1 Tax=Halioxenophilus aromaticivorans TaxID=1306992 RepID=A0AAV3U2Q1_9ALTE